MKFKRSLTQQNAWARLTLRVTNVRSMFAWFWAVLYLAVKTLHWSWTWYQIQSKPIKVSVIWIGWRLQTPPVRSLSVFHLLAVCPFVGGNIILPKITKLRLRLFNNLHFQHRSVRNRSPKSRPKSTNSALLVLTSVCSRSKFEPLVLNALLSTGRKSSHEHWTIPKQRSPHLLYMYKTRAT